MNQQLQDKAVAVLETNDQAALSFLEALIANPQQTQNCINLINQSEQYLFVICNVLIKKLKNNSFLNHEASEFRIICCRLILIKCAQILVNYHENTKKHITETLIDLSVHSLQALLVLHRPNNSLIFEYIGLYLKNFIPHENILDESSFHEKPHKMKTYQIFPLNNYIICSRVLTKLIEKICENQNNDLRTLSKVLKWFTDNYLEHILSYEIKYSKLLLNSWLQTEEAFSNFNLNQAISASLGLLDSLITFPFFPGYNDQEYQNNLDKIAPEPLIKFPDFYHRIVYDTQFTQLLKEYFVFLVKKGEGFSAVHKDIISILRIFGRIFNAEKKKLLSNRQEQLFQENNLEIIITLCRNFKFYDDYYLCSLFDLFDKVVLYGTCSCGREKISDLNFALAEFANKIISLGNALFTSDGRCSLPKRCFQLLQYCRRKFCGEETEVLLKISYQNIFQAFIESLAIQQSFHSALNELYSLEDEQNCFEELSNKISSFYFSFSEKNNERLLSMKLDRNCHPQIKSFWFYFISCLFVKADGGQCEQQVSIILKFVDLSKKQNIPGCILFLRKLALECMAQAVENGKIYHNTTPLWLGIHRATNENFNSFLQSVIEKFLSSLVFPYEKTLRASIESLDKLKVHLFRGLNFFPNKTMRMIENFSENIDQTPFQDVRLRLLRKDFFSLISQIWLNSLQKNENIYEMYKSIKKQLFDQDNKLRSLMNFLTDYTGLLHGLNKNQAQTLLQISIEDFKGIFNEVLASELLNLYFSDLRFDEIFIDFAHIVVKKIFSLELSQHNKLTLDYHQFLFPYLKYYGQHFGNPKLCGLWTKFGQMNPIHQLLPLTPEMKPNSLNIQYLDDENSFTFEYNTMVKFYFQNLHRVENFSSMFQYTFFSVNLMKMWWQQAIMEHPNLNIKIDLPEYANKMVKNMRQKVPKNLKQKIDKLGEIIYEVEKNFPCTGSLNLQAKNRKEYCEEFGKIAWNMKTE